MEVEDLRLNDTEDAVIIVGDIVIIRPIDSFKFEVLLDSGYHLIIKATELAYINKIILPPIKTGSE